MAADAPAKRGLTGKAVETQAKRPRGRPYKFSQGDWEAAASRLDGSKWRGLLLVCPEHYAMQVLLHLGEPDVQHRREPQALLSVPTALTRPETVGAAANQAISSDLWTLARRFSPSTQLRGELLRSALMGLGCDLWGLEHHSCLAALHLPYTSQEVEAAVNEDERYLRGLCNKVDLCTTAYGRCKTLHDLTELLQRQCRLTVEPKLLTQEMQLGMRRKLGVGLPLQCKDAFGATVHVILCSEEVHLYQKGDLLVLSDAPAAPAPTPQLADPREGWFCFTSRKTGLLYYWNAVTNVSTPDAPWGGEPGGLLPDGWTCQVDGSTGRLHFHHPTHGTTMRLP